MVVADKPPMEKLPLVVRKNVRDKWENNRADLEKQISDLLGESYTVEVNPNAIYPYAEPNSYGSDNLGDCISKYVEGAIYQMKRFLGRDGGENLKTEINVVVTARKLTVVAWDIGSQYNGGDVQDGVLRILFSPKSLGSNVDDAFQYLPKIISSAPQPAGASSLSFAARNSVKAEYETKIGAVLEEAQKQLENPSLKFEPNFEEIGKALKASKDARDDWETNLGNFTLKYYEAFVDQLKRDKFDEDGMLREGFEEAVPSGTVNFRIAAKVTSYNQLKIDDGVLYLETTTGNWGSNVDDVARKLIETL